MTPGPAAAVAGAAASDQAGDVAQAGAQAADTKAGENLSKGLAVALALGVGIVGYLYVKTAMNVQQGIGGAGQAVGSTLGGLFDFGGEVAGGPLSFMRDLDLGSGGFDVPNPFAAASNAGTEAGNWFGDQVDGAVDDVTSAPGDAVDGIEDTVDGAVDGGSSIIDDATGAVGGLF